MSPVEPELYSYFDYRQYLWEYYQWKKSISDSFSYRYIAQKIGVDHSLVIKIFNGERHIAPAKVASFIRLLNLTEESSEYFRSLVNYCKSRKESEKERLFSELISLIPAKRKTIALSQYEYFQHWYYAAIRSLLEYFDFSDDYRALARQLSPKISVSEARESITLLEKLHLIERNKAGRYVPTENHITTGESWHSLAIKQYQEETIRLSVESMKRHHKTKTDISTITMSMNREGMPEIRDILKECRQKIIGVVNRFPPEDIDTLYQLNMQLFPLVDEDKK